MMWVANSSTDVKMTAYTMEGRARVERIHADAREDDNSRAANHDADHYLF